MEKFRDNNRNIIKRVIIFLIILLYLIAILIAFVFYSKNINDVLGLPKMENTTLDLKNRDLSNFYTALFLKGDYEFFYNRWIITDNDNNPPDGLLTLPERWTGKTYNGIKLDNTGYASYRCYVKNINPGELITVTLTLYSNAFRVFVNGNLITESGVMSKTVKETVAYAEPQFVSFYDVDNQLNEIVVEISATDEGGLYYYPSLCSYQEYQKLYVGKNWFGNTIPSVFFSIAVLVFVLIIIFNLMKINKKSDYMFIVYIFFLMIHFFFTFDMLKVAYTVLNNFKFYHVFAYLSALLMFYTYIFLLKQYIPINKKSLNFILLLNLLVVPFYFLLIGYWYRYILCAVPLCSILYLIWLTIGKICSEEKYSKHNNIFLIETILLFKVLVLEITDNNGLCSVGAKGVYSIFFSLTMLLILGFYVMKIKVKNDEAQRAESMKKEIDSVKNQALKAQIKPHFIFNMLTNIQDQYHKEVAAGDAALAKFSKHLRLNVDSEYKDMIPFEEELDNIQNYFDLENIRHGGKLNLLYDIEFTDFSLPILSLQPLVENAVKYGKTDEKEDGYIQIRSYKDISSIVVEVNDNGIGFEIEKIRENATGLKNITERLKYSLGAKVLIDSKINLGTTIKIKISQKG